jgi:hypothetical protein
LRSIHLSPYSQAHILEKGGTHGNAANEKVRRDNEKVRRDNEKVRRDNEKVRRDDEKVSGNFGDRGGIL